jgi:hypothetical protein
VAAKKVSSSTPIDKAIADIKRRYPGTVLGEFKGVRSTNQAVQQFQDVVSESGLVDKYNNRTLMAAAAKVATQRFAAYGGGTEDARKERAALPLRYFGPSGKPLDTKTPKKKMK